MIKLLTPTAIVPTQATELAAGYDLYADEEVYLYTQTRALVRTGIALSLPRGTAGLIWPRSGLAVNQGVDVGAGVIDADYRGEVKVLLFNHGDSSVKIQKGDRIAQMLVQPLWMLDLTVVDALPETQRGAGGFGSTGG